MSRVATFAGQFAIRWEKGVWPSRALSCISQIWEIVCWMPCDPWDASRKPCGERQTPHISAEGDAQGWDCSHWVYLTHLNYGLKPHLFFRLPLLLWQAIYPNEQIAARSFLPATADSDAVSVCDCLKLLCVGCTRAQGWHGWGTRLWALVFVPHVPDGEAAGAHKPFLMHLDVFISREHRLGKRHLKNLFVGFIGSLEPLSHLIAG